MYELADTWTAPVETTGSRDQRLGFNLVGGRVAGTANGNSADDRLVLLRVMIDVEAAGRNGLGHVALPFMPEHILHAVKATRD